MEHKRTYRLVRGEVPDAEYTLPIGKADLKREGSDVTIITYGLMLHHCLEAAETVEMDDIDVEVLDLRTVRHLEIDSILETTKKTGKVLIVHEDKKALGVGAEVSAIISENAFEYLDGPVSRLAGPEIPAMPFAPPLEEMYMIDSEKIANSVRQLAEY